MIRVMRSAAVAAVGLSLTAAAVWSATTVRVASELNRPIYVASPPGDERLFIVEQRGVIKILSNGDVLSRPFLDIDALIPDISGNDERGLLGLVFDPRYAENGRFYVNYINLSGNTVIRRYHVSADPDSADPNSSDEIITINQPYANHNGGTLHFGPADGYLYIGMGDGGSGGDPGNRAQTPMELLGKVLRLDVSGEGDGYSIPEDNPFVGNPDYRPEIWSLGWRNPYRFSFDRELHDMWVGDVGQNQWEEVDFERAGDGGRNYGWRLMEGMHCYNPSQDCDDGDPVLTYPIHEYSHGQGCSITGGFVYRGPTIPELQGAYFFADYCSNRIWTLRYDGDQVTELTDRTAELAPGSGLTIATISSFGEDADGEIYICDRGNGTNGEIYKIVPDPAATPDHAFGLSDDPVRLRVSGLNPFRGSTRLDLQTAQSGLLEVDVVDVVGRPVRRLYRARHENGPVTLVWDGRSDRGSSAPSGLYFIRATIAGDTAISRVTLVR